MNKELQSPLKKIAPRYTKIATRQVTAQYTRTARKLETGCSTDKEPQFHAPSISMPGSIRKVATEGRVSQLMPERPISKIIKPTPIKVSEGKRLKKVEEIRRRRVTASFPLTKIQLSLFTAAKATKLNKIAIVRTRLEELSRVKVPLYKFEGQWVPSKLTQPKYEVRLRGLEVKKETQAAFEEVFIRGGGNVGTSVDFFDLLFECIEGEGEARDAFESAGPTILVLSRREDDDYAAAVQVICREVYRERTSERLDSMPVISRKNPREIENLEPSHKVSLIYDAETVWNKPVNSLVEFTRGNKPGFIIFYVSEDKARKFYEELREGLLPQKASMYLLGLKPLGQKAKERIASLAWGVVSAGSVPAVFSHYLTTLGIECLPHSFDELFLNGENEFKREMKKLQSTIYWTATKRHKSSDEGGVQESEVHFSLKAFVVRYYAQQLNLDELTAIQRQIHTEQDISGVRPDIIVKENGTEHKIEVETLYGQGFNPLKKIDETIGKYQENETIRIVLPGLTLLRYLKGIRRRSIHYRGRNISFLIPNLKDNCLMPMDEVDVVLREIEAEASLRVPGQCK